LTILLVALLVSACGSKDDPPAADAGPVQDTALADTAPDAGSDVSAAEDVAPLPDLAPDVPALADAVSVTADAGTVSDANVSAGDATEPADAVAGPCDPKTAGLHQVKYAVEDLAEVYAVAPLADGYAMAGVAEVKDGFDGLLIRADTTGKALWHKTFGGDGLELLYGIVAMPKGDLVVAGSSDSINGQSDLAWVVRLSAKGELVWQASFGAPGKANALGIARSGANLAVAGWREEDKIRQGMLLLLDDAGKPLSMVNDGAKGNSELAALEVDNAGVAAAGRRWGADASAPGAWLWRLDLKGKPVQSHTYAAPAMGGGSAEATSLAAVTGGGWVLGGWGPDAKGKKQVGWILRADGAGKALWSRSFADVPRVLGVAVSAKSIIGVGHHKSDGVVVAAWLRTGLNGSLSGTVPALATNARLHAVAIVNDKRVAAVGSLDGDKQTAGWLRIATAWGDAHCDNAGDCAALKLDGCLDNDPCTRDWCTSGTCDHGPLAKCP